MATQRYFMVLAYMGTNYHGWQRQPNRATIEGCISRALATLGLPDRVVGSGRTDAGVHAQAQVAHIDLPVATDLRRTLYALHALLPPDIRIKGFYPVPPTAHARFSASARTYLYQVHTMPSPFLTDRSYYYPHRLDLLAMNQGAARLLGEHPCESFCKQSSQLAHYRCTIWQATWASYDQGYAFMIKANRFLHGMVRILVGELLCLGRGRKCTADFVQLIAARERRQAGPPAPPQGLFLHQVHYPQGWWSKAFPSCPAGSASFSATQL